jgi:hypothetical protein
MPSVVDAESVWNAILQSPSVVSVYKQYCSHTQSQNQQHHHHHSEDSVRRRMMMGMTRIQVGSSSGSWMRCADSVLRTYRSDPSLQRRLFQLVGCSQSRPGINSKWEEQLHHWSSL